MTFSVAIGLFVAMVVLALLPGPGIVVVVSRTLSQGFRAGVVCTAGIVCGDFIFIALAILGLSSLAESYSEVFLFIRYFGAAYLIFLGVTLLRSSKSAANGYLSAKPSHHTLSFFAGLLTTLSNPKAILFYVSFFPTFLDLNALTVIDIVVLILITSCSLGGVMLGYAWAAHKTGKMQSSTKVQNVLRLVSAILLIGTGIYVAWFAQI